MVRSAVWGERLCVCACLCFCRQAGCRMWWNNQVLCVLVGGKHTVTRRHNDCSWCDPEQAQVKSFQVSKHPGVHSLVCLCVCMLSVSRPMKGLGLIRGFQTSVTLTLMNHPAPGSTCACGCEACLSKLMLLFTWDDPEGPGITRKQEHTTQTWHASFIGLSSSACTLHHCKHIL